MKTIRIMVAGALIALSGCAGSGGSSDPAFATPASRVGSGSSFASQNVKRYVLVNHTRSLKDQTIEVSFSGDGQTAYLAQNHKTYAMTRTAPGVYKVGNAILSEQIALSDFVHAMFFQDTVGTGYYNGGYFVLGYKTDPGQISAANNGGSASYSGQTRMRVANGAGSGFGTGTVTLNANFANSRVTGVMNVSHDPANPGTLSFADVTLTINPHNTANLTGNQFNTDLNIAFAPTPGTTVSIGQTGLSGNFYGVNAASAGGTYWGTGTRNGQPLFIEGAFATN